MDWKRASINKSLRQYAESPELVVAKRTSGDPTPQSLHGGNKKPKTR